MSKDLRERMVEDMERAGLSETTQQAYMRAVDTFVRRTWLSPEATEESDLAEYLRQLCRAGAARGTFKPVRHGLQFLFQNTLGRKWAIFEKNCRGQSRSACRKP